MRGLAEERDGYKKPKEKRGGKGLGERGRAGERRKGGKQRGAKKPRQRLRGEAKMGEGAH